MARGKKRGRPRKEGIDYFDMETMASNEELMVDGKHGNDGFAVLYKAKRAVFQSAKAELDISNDLLVATLAKQANVPTEVWEEIIRTCARAGLFDEKKLADRILTSDSIKAHLRFVSKQRRGWRNNNYPEGKFVDKGRINSQEKSIEENRIKEFKTRARANEPEGSRGAQRPERRVVGKARGQPQPELSGTVLESIAAGVKRG